MNILRGSEQLNGGYSNMKNATFMLEQDHRIIEKALGAMTVALDKLKTGRTVDKDALESISGFMSSFADKCHHGKEEGYLFPILEKQGVPAQGCPLGILIAEHKKGRTLVAELSVSAQAFAGGDSSAKAGLIKSLQGILELYPGHIWKEDFLLFPMADKILNPEQQKELETGFEKVENQFGAEAHSCLEKLTASINP